MKIIRLMIVLVAVFPVAVKAGCIPFFDDNCIGQSSSVKKESADYVETSDEEMEDLADAFASNNIALSEKVVKRLEQNSDLSLDDKILKAWILFKKSRYDEASELFREIGEESNIKLDPYLGPAWIAVKQGRYEDAEELIDKSREKAASFEKFLVSDISGWWALNQGDKASAEKHFLQVKRDLSNERINYTAQLDDWSYTIPDDVENNWEATPFISFGWLHIFSDRWDEAEQSFSKCFEQNQKGALCLDGLARVAMHREQYDKALEYLLDGIKITGGGDHGLNGLLGSVLYYINDPARNESIYKDLSTKYPDELVYKTALGYTYLVNDKYNKAKSSYKKGLRLNSDCYGCRDGLARVHLDQEDYEGALEQVLDGIKILDGKYSSLNGLLDLTLAYINDPARNESIYKDLSTKYPDELVYKTALGYTYLVNDKYNKAKSSYKKGLRLNSDCYGCRDGLARVHLDQEDYEGALEQVLDGIKILDGKYSSLNGLLDLTLAYINDPAMSESTYKKLVIRYPDEPVYLSGLGNTQIVIGKKQEGRENLKQYIKQWPETAGAQDIRYSLAWGLYFDKQNNDALKQLNDYFNHGGLSPNAYRCEAFSLFRLGRYSDAKDKLERLAKEYYLVSLAPLTEKVGVGESDNRLITYNVQSTLGWVNYHLGDMARARSIFSDLMQESPGWVDVIVGLGYVEVADGNMDEAQSQFNKALEIYPDYPDAIYGLGLL